MPPRLIDRARLVPKGLFIPTFPGRCSFVGTYEEKRPMRASLPDPPKCLLGGHLGVPPTEARPSEARRTSLVVEHLPHFPSEGFCGEGFLQEADIRAEHPVEDDGVVRVAGHVEHPRLRMRGGKRAR